MIFIPGGMIPDQQPGAFALGLQFAAAAGQKLLRDLAVSMLTGRAIQPGAHCLTCLSSGNILVWKPKSLSGRCNTVLNSSAVTSERRPVGRWWEPLPHALKLTESGCNEAIMHPRNATPQRATSVPLRKAQCDVRRQIRAACMITSDKERHERTL